MSISSVVAMKARALVDFPDNTAELITPALLRQFLIDFLDTISPAYGIIRLVSQILNLSAVPVVIAPYVQNHTESAGYFVNNLVAGKVTRTLNGALGSRTLIVAGGSVSGLAGREVTVRLYKNGVATDFSTTVSTTGAANEQAISLAGFDFFLGPTDMDYELRASCTGAAANFTFRNVTLVVQAQTVRDFV